MKSSNRNRSTTVRTHASRRAQPRPSRSTSPTTTVSRSAADRRLRPSARCAPIDRRRRRACTGRGSRLWASAWMCRPEPRPSIVTRAASGISATSRTVVMSKSRSLRAVTAPTPHSFSTGSGWRNSSSPSGGTTSSPSGFATPLATFARNFVLAIPTVIGSPTCSSTWVRSRRAISTGVPAIRSMPRTSRNASSIDSPSTSGDGLLEHVEHRPAGRRVRGHPWRHDDRIRAQPARHPSAHGGPDAARLRLVTRSQHHPSAHDDRPPAQIRVVALLDRRVEGVEVSVEDGGLTGHEHMFA